MDLLDCDPKVIRSKKKILQYLKELYRLLKIKRYGKPICKRFALDNPYATGFSLVQLIERGSLTGHFPELWNRGFINIFSCRLFNERKPTDFTKKIFGAKKIKNRVLIR